MATIETNVSGLTSRGMSYYYFKKYKKAFDDFNDAIHKNPKETAAFRYRGLVREKLNQVNEAIIDYSMAISINPEYDEVYIDRGRARRKLGQYKSAIWDFNEAIRINPYNAGAFEDRGKTKIESGDILSGNEDIDKAHQLRNRWRSGRSLVSIAVFLLLCAITTAPAQTTVSAEDVAEKALAATVYLEMKDKSGKTLGIGSGFFVKPNLIATNYHVIEGAAKGIAKLVGKYIRYNIEGITATDKVNDLALLKVTAYGIKPLSVGNSNTVRIGETVYVAGNPKGLEGTFSDGIISSRRDKYTKERLQMTAPISPGSSGGPVLNRSGEVIGVSFAGHRALDAQNLNFAIPSKYLKALLTRSKPAKPLLQGNDLPISAETYFLWGNAKYRLGDYAGAIADYTMAIQLKPDAAEAYNNRGVSKFRLERYAAAILDYDTAIPLKPNDATAYMNRGAAKQSLGQHFAAIVDYDAAIRLKPDYAMAYGNRGAAKFRLEQYAAAISDYDTAIRLKPDDAKVYMNRGVSKFRLERYAAAILDYDAAIQLKPDYAMAYMNRGIAKYLLERTWAAKQDLQTALKLAGKAGDTRLKADIKSALQKIR